MKLFAREGSAKRIVNIHCHFMTYDHLPDEYTKRLVKLVMGIPITFLPEKFIKTVMGSKSFNLIGSFLFGWLIKPNIFRAMRDELVWNTEHQPLDYGAVDNYLEHGEYSAGKDKKKPCYSDMTGPDELSSGSFKIPRLKGKVTQARYPYEIVVPLMMDMVTASNIYLLSDVDGVLDFSIQIQRYSNAAFKYPFRVFPFIMFNPMRSNSFDLIKDAVLKQGFTGIKLYPAMGYFADPEKNVFHKCRWKENCVNRHSCSEMKKSLCCAALNKLYRFADKHSLPIVLHTQYPSMQNIALDRDEAAEYTDVSDFSTILEKYPGIRLNFAHFGGVEFIQYARYRDKKNWKAKLYRFSCKCRNDIAYLMNRFNTPDHTRVFADTAANLFWLKSREKKYFSVLYSLLKNDHYKKAILFGTDTPAISVFITDKKYRQTFVRGLDEQHKQTGGAGDDVCFLKMKNRFFFDNSVDFLFGPDRKIPETYLQFLAKELKKSKLNRLLRPDWLEVE